MRAIARRTIAHYKGELKDIVGSILSGTVKDGPHIKRFEEEFARYVGTTYAIAVASGRVGLFLVLDSLALEKDAAVMLPAYTDESVPSMIIELGLRPVFIDIERDTHNIDVARIEKMIDEKTRVIIATHIFGRPCNLSKVTEIARAHDLIVIEDCAHALGATYQARRVGSFGAAAYFSFGISKPFNTFGGGMITTSDPRLYAQIKKKQATFPFPSTFVVIKNVILAYCLWLVTRPLLFSLILYPLLLVLSLFDQDLLYAYNSTAKRAINFGKGMTRYTNMQARVGLEQLTCVDQANRMRVYNATLLKSRLSKKIKLLKDEVIGQQTDYFFIILASDIKILSRKLIIRGIDSGKHLMRNCAALYGNYPGFLGVEEAIKASVQIPLYPELERGDIEYIARVLNEAYHEDP